MQPLTIIHLGSNAFVSFLRIPCISHQWFTNGIQVLAKLIMQPGNPESSGTGLVVQVSFLWTLRLIKKKRIAYRKTNTKAITLTNHNSLRGRRPKRRERGKNERAKAVRVGDACKETKVLFSSFRPNIEYAKPTQLWNVWLSKLSNQNDATYLMAKSVGANGFSYFLFLFFARENEIIWRSLEDGKSEKRPAHKRKQL